MRGNNPVFNSSYNTLLTASGAQSASPRLLTGAQVRLTRPLSVLRFLISTCQMQSRWEAARTLFECGNQHFCVLAVLLFRLVLFDQGSQPFDASGSLSNQMSSKTAFTHKTCSSFVLDSPVSHADTNTRQDEAYRLRISSWAITKSAS